MLVYCTGFTRTGYDLKTVGKNWPGPSVIDVQPVLAQVLIKSLLTFLTLGKIFGSFENSFFGV